MPAAVDAADGPALVVGHSAAAALAWVAADARPEKVARMALIGGMPSNDGETYFGFSTPSTVAGNVHMIAADEQFAGAPGLSDERCHRAFDCWRFSATGIRSAAETYL